MGKVSNSKVSESSFTPIQKIIFDEFSENNHLRKQFYFTGGTALSAIYLHHRESEDLDFFSENDFSNSIVEAFINRISERIKIPFRLTQIEKTRMFEFIKDRRVIIKVDFGCYPYKRLKRGIKVKGVTVDNLYDIAVNKLHTVTARNHVKDFVDLYFLLQKFTFWDLWYGVEKKFRMELDLVWMASDFLKVKNFDYLPKMLVSLKLEELKDFYKELAKKITMTVVER
ncbi:MAG: hypothetical protein CEO21_7 [Microgenomates group bacterium Gr01-1014_80]|nr:MAG: hypothetical protein CEO21_7 [Microgenomates group bacterium Gr01-1014_80]